MLLIKLLSIQFCICTAMHIRLSSFPHCIAPSDHMCLLTGMSKRSLGVELHCRCIQTESKPIGRHIEKVELIPANSHCDETEIM